MAKILAANRANVLINGETVEGLQEITYRSSTPWTDIPAIGSRERVSVVFGTAITGTLRIRSLSATCDQLLESQEAFQIFVSVDAPGGEEVEHELTLDDCYLHGKQHAMGAGGAAETLYEFSASRQRG